MRQEERLEESNPQFNTFCQDSGVKEDPQPNDDQFNQFVDNMLKDDKGQELKASLPMDEAYQEFREVAEKQDKPIDFLQSEVEDEGLEARREQKQK